MHSLLFCAFSFFVFCLQCLDQKYWVFYGVMYLFKEEEESSKSSLHIPPPSSTQFTFVVLGSLRQPN